MICMRIILDTDKKTITVPWNYQQKLDEINKIAEQYGGEGFQRQSYTGYIDNIWKECIKNSDKHVFTAQRHTK